MPPYVAMAALRTHECGWLMHRWVLVSTLQVQPFEGGSGECGGTAGQAERPTAAQSPHTSSKESGIEVDGHF